MNKSNDYLNEFVLIIVTILSVFVLSENADAQEASAYKRLTIEPSIVYHGSERPSLEDR